MNTPPVFVEYREPISNQLYQVPVACFDPANDLAVIIHKKQFIKVSLVELQFSRWDI